MKQVYFLLCVFTIGVSCHSQTKLSVMRSNESNLSIRENGEYLDHGWRISPGARPDSHTMLVAGKTGSIVFISDVDSLSFTMKAGEKVQFWVLYRGDSALTEIIAKKFTPPAVFDPKYIKTHSGKTFTEIPEVYELVNIVFALTDVYKKDKWGIAKNTAYYKDVINQFDKFSDDPLVKEMNGRLPDQYAVLKMDGYAFNFDAKGKIVQSKIYDRASWGSDNTLRPLIPALQKFSDRTGFRNFYRAHRAFYDAQIRGYRDSVGIAEMLVWLRKNFPATNYNSFKVIWSPLVNGNQSANWMESNGFKEAHQHVNFPYPEWYTKGSRRAIDLQRGNIIFTELNHSFINPEAEQNKYFDIVNAAFKDLKHWATPEFAGYYPNAFSMFEEYMNWGLVSLYYVDNALVDEQAMLIAEVDRIMTKNRGFIRFSQFNAFLVDLYKNRAVGQTVADLYPAILAWCKEDASRP